MIVNIQEIMDLIPHRYPFLLVDKIIDLIPGEFAVGIKNVTFNEPQFMGHFPSMPVMPGVLIIEAMAQVSAILVAKTINAKKDDKVIFFMSIDEAKFRKIVSPGDTMYIHAKVERNRGAVWKFSAKALVNDNIVSEAIFSAMIKDKE